MYVVITCSWVSTCILDNDKSSTKLKEINILFNVKVSLNYVIHNLFNHYNHDVLNHHYNHKFIHFENGIKYEF